MPSSGPKSGPKATPDGECQLNVSPEALKLLTAGLWLLRELDYANDALEDVYLVAQDETIKEVLVQALKYQSREELYRTFPADNLLDAATAPAKRLPRLRLQ